LTNWQQPVAACKYCAEIPEQILPRADGGVDVLVELVEQGFDEVLHALLVARYR
jgi:hypothetical protein